MFCVWVGNCQLRYMDADDVGAQESKKDMVMRDTATKVDTNVRDLSGRRTVGSFGLDFK